MSPDDLQYCFRWDSEMNTIDALLTHEATGEDLCQWDDATDAGRSCDNDNKAIVACPDYIYTAHFHTI